jgi:hypothetical protein
MDSAGSEKSLVAYFGTQLHDVSKTLNIYFVTSVHMCFINTRHVGRKKNGCSLRVSPQEQN